jgi:hypothetical protein
MPDALSVQDAAWRALYDELDQERIAIHPIDARASPTAVLARKMKRSAPERASSGMERSSK